MGAGLEIELHSSLAPIDALFRSPAIVRTVFANRRAGSLGSHALRGNPSLDAPRPVSLITLKSGLLLLQMK